MILRHGTTLLASVCNAVPSAVPYALWFGRGQNQYLVDLSDVLGQTGDCGLTGLTYHRDRIYVAVQANDTARILILDRRLCPVGVIQSPAFRDIHSIHAAGDSLIVCSTGTQAVLRVDLSDHSIETLCAFDQNVHLNAACFFGHELLICCHYPSRVVPNAVGGGVLAPGRRQVVIDGLGQPHSVLPDTDTLLILDSEAHRVLRFGQGVVQRQRVLSGFLRGLGTAHDSLFVGRSPGRVISRKNPIVENISGFWDMQAKGVSIYELDATTLQVKAEHHPLVAGFELYELLSLDEAWGLDPAPERLLVPDIHAMARAYYEAAKRAGAELHQQIMAEKERFR